MNRLLVYIEPHPIRNSFTSFLSLEFREIIKALVRFQPESYDLRFFSNNYVIDEILEFEPSLKLNVYRPTIRESQIIETFLTEWNEEHVSLRNQLVRGDGDISNFYYSILSRIYNDNYQFNCILSWSDNGAVKKFAQKHKIKSLFAELGPTRAPFTKTIYFDVLGTNCSSSILDVQIDKLKTQYEYDRAIWIPNNLNALKKETTPSLYDGPMTISTEKHTYNLYDNEYIYVPLQLADDLNIQLCSKFLAPSEFLKSIAEEAKRNDIKILVKGHPGAASRPFNYKHQYNALKLANIYDIEVLPNDISIEDTLRIIYRSLFTLSINSSSSYEAALLGKKSYIVGKANYNVGNVFSYPGLDIILKKTNYNSDKLLNNVINFLNGHYFHPFEIVTNSTLIFDIFDFLDNIFIYNKNSFWQEWCDHFRTGFDFLNEIKYEKKSSNNNVLSLYTSNDILINKINKEEKIFNIQYQKTMNTAYFQNRDIFKIRVDSLSTDSQGVKLTGWAINKSTSLPANKILFIYNDNNTRNIVGNQIYREDVNIALNLPDSLKYGYSMEFKCNSFDIKNLQLILFDEIGSCELFTEIQLGELQYNTK